MATTYPDILMLTPDRQIDRRILLAAESLMAAGMSVVIISLPPDRPCLDPSHIVRVGTPDFSQGREWKVFNVYQLIKARLSNNFGLVAWLKRLAWRYLVDQERFYFNLFYKTVICYRPKVFIAHDLPMLPVAAFFAQQCQAKLVYDSHELFCEQDFSSHEKNKWKLIEKTYINRCDQVITVNESIATELRFRYQIQNIEVVYNAEKKHSLGRHNRLFHHKFNLSPCCNVLLLQGGLGPERNLEVLVRSMKFVSSCDVVLVILGSGPLLARLRAICKRNNLFTRVYFHEQVDQSSLLEFTASADAGVIPYKASCLNSYFCTPNKLFEFVSAGLPVLSTDLPEISKIILGYHVGLVGDTSTPRSFALLIDNFFSDESRLSLWRSNSLQARESVCWEIEGAKYVSLIQRLI